MFHNYTYGKLHIFIEERGVQRDHRSPSMGSTFCIFTMHDSEEERQVSFDDLPERKREEIQKLIIKCLREEARIHKLRLAIKSLHISQGRDYRIWARAHLLE